MASRVPALGTSPRHGSPPLPTPTPPHVVPPPHCSTPWRRSQPATPPHPGWIQSGDDQIPQKQRQIYRLLEGRACRWRLLPPPHLRGGSGARVLPPPPPACCPRVSDAGGGGYSTELSLFDLIMKLPWLKRGALIYLVLCSLHLMQYQWWATTHSTNHFMTDSIISMSYCHHVVPYMRVVCIYTWPSVLQQLHICC